MCIRDSAYGCGSRREDHALVPLSSLRVPEVRPPDYLVLGGVHRDHGQPAAWALASAFASAMLGVDFADESWLARFDVTGPGHHQFAQRSLGAFDGVRANLYRGRSDPGHGRSDCQLSDALAHSLFKPHHGVHQAGMNGRPLILGRLVSAVG